MGQIETYDQCQKSVQIQLYPLNLCYTGFLHIALFYVSCSCNVSCSEDLCHLKISRTHTLPITLEASFHFTSQRWTVTLLCTSYLMKTPNKGMMNSRSFNYSLSNRQVEEWRGVQQTDMLYQSQACVLLDQLLEGWRSGQEPLIQVQII